MPGAQPGALASFPAGFAVPRRKATPQRSAQCPHCARRCRAVPYTRGGDAADDVPPGHGGAHPPGLLRRPAARSGGPRPGRWACASLGAVVTSRCVLGAAVALPGGCVPAGGSPRGDCVWRVHHAARMPAPGAFLRTWRGACPTAFPRLRAAGLSGCVQRGEVPGLLAYVPPPPHPPPTPIIHTHTHTRLPLDADAERAEVVHQPPLDFGCTIMVLGLSGVGKTATINSLLGRQQPAGYRETGRVRCPAAWGPCPTHAGLGAAPGASWPAGPCAAPGVGRGPAAVHKGLSC